MCKIYLQKYKIKIIIYLIINVLIGFFVILNPYITGNFIDTLVEGNGMASVYRFCLIFAFINIIRLFLSYVKIIIYTKVQSMIAHEFSQDVIQYMQNLSLSYINEKDTDYLTQVINGDTNVLVAFCIDLFRNFIVNTINIIIPLIILIRINAFVTAVLLVFISMYIFIYINFKKLLYIQNKALLIKQDTFLVKLLEQLKFTKYIKVHVIDNIFRKKMDILFNKLLNESLKSQKLNYIYFSLDSIVTSMAQIALFVLGGYLILAGNFTLGMFSVFSMYFNMILGSAKFFFDFGKKYQESLVSYDRLREIFESALETYGNEELPNIYKIQVKKLNFSFDELLNQKVINELSVEFRKNNIYGIVGHNGSGKSTFINLLLGLYIKESQGKIYFNGRPMHQLNMLKLRREHIGLAEQKPILLNASILTNLVLDAERKNISEDTLAFFLDHLGLSDVINKFPDKLETIIDENSSNLSGGEQQKISIIRLLLKDPDVMIFDEPTSAFDFTSSLKFMSLLKGIKHNKIILIVTHDKNIIEQCDALVEFSNQKNL